MELQWEHWEKKLIAKAYPAFLMNEGWEQGFITAITFTLQASSKCLCPKWYWLPLQEARLQT